MTDKIEYATLLSDSEKGRFDENDLFDRVINLKIKTTEFASGSNEDGSVKYAAEEFVIRSDYELYYPNQNIVSSLKGKNVNDQWSIRKCEMKPAIKVQYTQINQGTNISLDIFISNFFLTTKDGRTLMSFNQQTYNIDEIEIQMGYIGQFNKLLGLDRKRIEDLTYDDLFDFNPGFGVDTLIIGNVEYVKVEKLTPDYVIHIHGYVGTTLESAPSSVSENVTYKDIPKNLYFSTDGASEKSVYEELFYNYITKRFINTKIAEKGKPLPKYDKDGFFSDADADKFGLKVVCSEGVKKIKALPVLKDSNGGEVQVSTYMSLGGTSNTANSAMQRLCEFTKNQLCYARLTNGALFVYTAKEAQQKNIKKLYESIEKETGATQVKSHFNNIIPAVYSINIDALATIVCPFFSWMNPFQELYFASRYALTSLVSFYAGFTPEISRFYAINVKVSFATVEDVNEMQITAVPDFESKMGISE